MEVQFFKLLESEDSLDLGPRVGSLCLNEESYELTLEDHALEQRLMDLIEGDDLSLKCQDPTGGTAFWFPEPGGDDWVRALLDRLEMSDFRLFGQVTE